MKLRIDDTGINMCNKRFSLHQQFQAFHDIRCGDRQYLADNIVAAGRLPKSPGTTSMIKIVDNGPGVKNVCLPEPVSVIPVANLRKGWTHDSMILFSCADSLIDVYLT